MTHLSPLASWLLVAMIVALVVCGIYLLHLFTAHEVAEGVGPARRPVAPNWPDGSPLNAFADLLHDDYADAAEDDLTPLERHVADALRVASLDLADDGCWPGDHDRGVHSPWRAADVVRIPRQRGAR